MDTRKTLKPFPWPWATVSIVATAYLPLADRETSPTVVTAERTIYPKVRNPQRCLSDCGLQPKSEPRWVLPIVPGARTSL
jgi:hypothetical protein